MLERCYRRQHVCRRVRANPLGSALERFACYLLERGHNTCCIQQYLQAAEHFGRWLGIHRIEPAAFDTAVARRFIERHLPRCRCAPPAPCNRICVRAALRHLLRCTGRWNDSVTDQATGSHTVRAVIEQFDQYLQSVAGLSQATRLYRRRYAREFLEVTFRHGPVRWERITPELVMNWVADYVRRCSPATGQVAASALRSLLRFAQLHGFCQANLAATVPRIPDWQHGGNRKSLTGQQVCGLLKSFDRATVNGRRDYAMALCMTDLGLRVSEVASLCLEDLDWRNATMRIALSKGRYARILPLPQRVGSAIAAYLRHGRPSTEHRQLFLRHRAPIAEPVSKELIRGSIRRAYAACGLDRRFTGTHVLRHTAACLMHERGATLKEIADLLGHRSLDTTVVYAKANLRALATAALPWPEVRS